MDKGGRGVPRPHTGQQTVELLLSMTRPRCTIPAVNLSSIEKLIPVPDTADGNVYGNQVADMLFFFAFIDA